MSLDRVALVGQKEFIAALRRLDATFPSQVNKAMRNAANQVASRSRTEYMRRYRQGTSKRRSRSVKGITPIAGGRKAGVKLDGAKRPWLVGQEFGSDRPKMRRFAPWTGKGPRGMGSRGRFLYPVIRDEIDDVVDQLADDLEGIFRVAVAQAGGL